MKFYLPKDIDGNTLTVLTPEHRIFDDDGRSLTDKLDELERNLTTMLDNIDYINSSLLELEGRDPVKPPESLLDGVSKRSDKNANICLLKINGDTVTSDYGLTYKKLAGILYTGDYSEYIKDGDWIELNVGDGGTYKLYANIDPYYGEADDSGATLTHHIDFISDNLIYGSVGNNKAYNYTTTNIDSWRMNNDQTLDDGYGYNSGNYRESSPFLANSVKNRGSEGGIIDKLNAFYDTYFPEELKNHIVKKYNKIPIRYEYGKNRLTVDNGSKWAEMPYLWIPYDKEVFGINDSPTSAHEVHMRQYYVFSNVLNFKKKYDKKYYTDRTTQWWTASSAANSIDYFVTVTSDGTASKTFAGDWRVGVPICFRFNSREFKSTPLVRDAHAGNVCLLSDNDGALSSGFNYDYDFLADTLDSGNYSNYIKNGDWIELKTSDGGKYKLYANVDTYYGDGEDGKKIGHHIDFISKELIYGSTSSINGSCIYEAATPESWRMNCGMEDWGGWSTNNGTEDEKSPFLSNSLKHRPVVGGIIDKLDDYFYRYIPSGLKEYITKKYHKVPTRYQEGKPGKSIDDGSKWAELPYLWIPYYKEVWGANTTNEDKPTATYEVDMKQYHSFSSIDNFRIKCDDKDSHNSHLWWTASAMENTPYAYCGINTEGSSTEIDAKLMFIGTPLCFRFSKTGGFKLRKDETDNICLLSDTNGSITSDYNYDYDFISNMLKLGKHSEYVKDGDWIELTTNDGYTHKLYTNVDTYYGQGDGTNMIGHHIDFISRNLIPGSNSWFMRTDVTNNGVATEQSPFLSSSKTYRTDGELIDKLNEYYNNNIPSSIKGYIMKKYHNIPYRYSSSSSKLTADNGNAWRYLPYLWLPYEREIYGRNNLSTFIYEQQMKQYHSFSSIENFITKYDITHSTTSNIHWWTASAGSYDSAFCVAWSAYNTSNQAYSNRNYSQIPVGSPLCFRIGGELEQKDTTVRSDSSKNICLLKDNMGSISSDNNYSYDFLSSVLQSGNYSDYIKDGDWIELTTKDGYTHKMYANVDTYYGVSDGSKTIGHHIDFISRNLIPGSYEWEMRTARTNNGVAAEQSPFLSSTTKYRSDGVMIDKLNTYYNNMIHPSIKSHIVSKYHNVPLRYSASSTQLKTDTGKAWKNMGNLWLPYATEVRGVGADTARVDYTYESHMKQYYTFKDGFYWHGSKLDETCIDANTGKVYNEDNIFWWTASADKKLWESFVGIFSLNCGIVNIYSNSLTMHSGQKMGAPLCFRFQ